MCTDPQQLRAAQPDCRLHRCPSDQLSGMRLCNPIWLLDAMIEMPGRFARGTKVGMRGREGRRGRLDEWRTGGWRSGGGAGERPRGADDEKKDAK